MIASLPHDLPWAIYIRVSTKDQGLKFSPVKQLSACSSWAKANGASVPGIETAISGNIVRPSEFVLFDKQTGKTDDRPDFQRALELARSRKIGGIICYCVDRAARNVVDAISLRKNLKKMGVQLQFATQTFDDSPSGNMMYTMFSAYSEFEGQIILERTGNGRLRRVQSERKLHSGGSVRYGYKYDNGAPLIHEPEAKIARIILEMGSKGDTAYSIFQYLNRSGYRTRKGKLWLRETVSHILAKADCYAGIATYRHGIEAAKREHAERVAIMGEDAPPIDLSSVISIENDIYPPLITPETARQIMAVLAFNKKAKIGRPSRKYLLRGLLWCLVCGQRWITRPGGSKLKQPCYRCGNLDRTGTFRKLCTARQMTCEHLEAIVLDAMKDYLRRPEVAYAMAIEDYESQYGVAAKKRRSESEKHIAEIQHEQAYLDRQVLRSNLPKRTRDLAEKRLHELEIEELNIKAELRQTRLSIVPSKEAIIGSFRQLLQELDHLETFEDKREFLEATVSRIETDGHTVKIIGKIGGTPDVGSTPVSGADPAESGGSGKKKCNRGLDGDVNSFTSIPFKINRRVA